MCSAIRLRRGVVPTSWDLVGSRVGPGVQMAKTKDEPVVEDVDDDISSDEDSDDVPDLEEADGSARGKQSKMEKKSRSVTV